MAEKAVAPNKTLINPIFGIPAGAEDQFVYTDDTEFVGATGVEEVSEFASSEGDEQAEEGFSEGEEYWEDEDQLETPTDFHVFAQTLRRAPGGQQVVDVIVEAEDVGGAINYEFQVTKL